MMRTTTQWHKAAKDVRSGRSIPVLKRSNRHTVHIVEHEGEEFVLLYDRKRGIIGRQMSSSWIAVHRKEIEFARGTHKRPLIRVSIQHPVALPMVKPEIIGWMPVYSRPEDPDPEAARRACTRQGRMRRIARYLMMRDGDRCVYCEAKVSTRPAEGYREATVDHLVPRSRGGPNDFSNLVVACKECYGEKADLMPDVFMRQIWGNDLEHGCSGPTERCTGLSCPVFWTANPPGSLGDVGQLGSDEIGHSEFVLRFGALKPQARPF